MRIYHNHELREDWKQGLYMTRTTNEDDKIKKCVTLLSSKSLFKLYAKKMITAWKYSCEHYLTDPSRNKRAYIGQATCCYFCGAPDYVTKIAWNKLTKQKQNEANLVATSLIRKFIRDLTDGNQLKLV